ncbi:MAG TPA: hypothetical protein VEA99_02245 [Gemmatimonadaceae bacterium]|nr:hypothetical protein [Gemmatimonadaceae bacterium]
MDEQVRELVPRCEVGPGGALAASVDDGKVAEEPRAPLFALQRDPLRAPAHELEKESLSQEGVEVRVLGGDPLDVRVLADELELDAELVGHAADCARTIQ